MEGCGNDDAKKVDYLLNRAINTDIELSKVNDDLIKVEKQRDEYFNRTVKAEEQKVSHNFGRDDELKFLEIFLHSNENYIFCL